MHNTGPQSVHKLHFSSLANMLCNPPKTINCWCCACLSRWIFVFVGCLGPTAPIVHYGSKSRGWCRRMRGRNLPTLVSPRLALRFDFYVSWQCNKWKNFWAGMRRSPMRYWSRVWKGSMLSLFFYLPGCNLDEWDAAESLILSHSLMEFR